MAENFQSKHIFRKFRKQRESPKLVKMLPKKKKERKKLQANITEEIDTKVLNKTLPNQT